MHAVLLLFVVSCVCFCLAQIELTHSSFAIHILAVLGAGTCGVSWMLARLLFRGDEADLKWAWRLLSLLYLSYAVFTISDQTGTDSPFIELAGVAASNLYAFVGTVTLALGFVEAFSSSGHNFLKREQYFRYIYISVYGALVLATAILAPMISNTLPIDVFVLCCLAGMIVGIAAVWHRQRNSLSNAILPKPSAPLHPQASSAARKVHELFQTSEIYTDPEISVSRLAQLVGEPKHRVSQGIKSQLGFANFNQLVNSYRVKKVATVLESPDSRSIPILTIALDSGFSSLGPFNQAFKETYGVTPSEYRKALMKGTRN
ncbi:AraC family transcriptional regulator [Oceanicaulis sp. MMSF_3324]|uniref:helix-turn-helix transcriptional regulator n=1 Tax=Oceanicaulis sp. MMSF_3324 TaxID=3046702 RepID=UPI00273FFA90|nr:AraC family transcriptional regulator [Oceanicaulis sp. MMSF_3324]